jgi:hypothetical protein
VFGGAWLQLNFGPATQTYFVRGIAMGLLLLLGQTADTGSPFLTLLQTEKFIPAIAIVGGLSVATIWMLMHYFYSWIELCKNNEIKLRMIEAGHSADEIERVVCAGQVVDEDEDEKPKRSSRRAVHVPPAKPITQHVA